MYDKVTKKFRRKTLVDEIRSILQQYPDDGQIFKEIIQNAEDAGASEVVFIYDKNDDRRQGLKLSKDSFEKHQGPSLFAYNNARFDDDDWDGIISLGISKKAKDALKVGRFGLGFKSVFHLTDMPSVASGSTFAYLDPMEDTLGEEVTLLDMDPDKLAEVQEYDDFKAFHRLGRRFWEPNNSTDGAIFRFPLRQERSNLSTVCYNQKRFERLMVKFMKEAYLTMIFLKHVKSIQIFSIGENSSNLQEIYSASISDQCNQQYQIQKKEFVDDVNARTVAKAFQEEHKLEHELELVVLRDRKSSTYRYAISELFGFSGTNKKFRDLMEDEDLSYIPLISTAYPLTPNDPGGHIFSGLPIPLQSQRMNGMPVHVNGFFALGQDRKDLKWKTLSTDESSDKTVNWNIHLIRELLPSVYANLIQFLIRRQIESEIVYQAWPIQQNTDSKWTIFLDKFYKIMMNTACIFIPWNDLWTTPSNTWFLKNEEIKKSQLKIVQKFLSMTGQNVASAPPCVIHNLTNISWIDKSVVQKYINQYQNVYASISIAEKCLVLSYAVDEANDLKKISGKRIFPLVNGSYFELSKNNGSTFYYLPTIGHEKELLTSEARVIDVAFFAADNQFLDNQFLDNIISIFRQGFFNVVVLENTRSVIKAIRSTFPNHWQQSDTQTVNWPDDMINISWLPDFSVYCRRNRIRLSELEGMPFIPVESNGRKKLLKVSKKNKPMTSKNMKVQISNKMEMFLQNCGLWFVEQSMAYEDMWSLLNEGYVLEPTSENIFGQLERHCEINKILQAIDADETNIRNEICTLIKQHCGKLPSICNDLPLFKGYKSSVYHSARNTTVLDKQDVPEIWNASYGNIVLRQETDINLISQLQMTFWTFDDLCKFIVNKSWFSLKVDQQVSFSRFFLERCISIPNGLSKNLQNLMKDSIKIRDCDGNVCEPKKLFQKTAQLESFFFGEHGKFPSDSYNMSILNRFGLKPSSSLKIQEVNDSIKMVNSLNGDSKNSPNSILEKVKAILEIIRANNLNRKSLVKKFPWIPVATTTPRGYPENLIWLGNNNKITNSPERVEEIYLNALNVDSFEVEYLYKIYNETYQELVGSVRYVIHPIISSEFNACFDGTSCVLNTPDISLVMQHLKNVEKCYTDDEKGYFNNIILKIYSFLSKHSSKVISVARSEGLQVWQGNKFVKYQEVVNTNVRAVPDLAPYFYVPPVEVLKALGSILQQLKCSRTESDVYIAVLKKIAEQNNHRTKPGRDSDLAFPIVNALAKEYLAICETRKSEIFVPVEGSGLQLQPLHVCLYHDFDKNVEYQTSQSNNYILHRHFDKDLAKMLKVPSLISKVLSGSKNHLFQQWGQSESLTLKLKRLLEDYKDGLAIVKELIQNADDAGATEVKFLYDQRRNNELKGHLIDPQMKEWQGPALWVYNNQEFLEKDFENITKLNAGTKEFDTTKIGKFGLGFNSVYHLTDVPSFLSSDSLVIFDPHTTYLGEALENQPGIRIPITEAEKKEELMNFKDQFKVYHDVFGAKLDFSSNDAIQPYNGTLFRLPLRTSTATSRSDIKKMEYNEKEMNLLLKKLEESINTLILFTQNVSSIAVYKLADLSSSPTQQELLFSVTKNVENLSKGESDSNIMSIANQELARYRYNHCSYQIPVWNIVEKVSMTTSIKNKKTVTTWINFSIIGSQTTFKFAENSKRHIPCGGISCQFLEERNKSGFTLKPVQLVTGQMFCFLPLPIRNEIPIHVNGAFDTSRDRQSLQFHNEDEKEYGSDNWNDLLSVDIGHAYYNLLVHLKEYCPDATFQDFISCFPRKSPAPDVSKTLLKAVLEKCTSSKDKIIPVRIENNTKWVRWNQLKVLNFKSTVTLTYISFLNWFFSKKEQNVCLDLTKEFQNLLNTMGFQEELKSIVITKTTVRDIFLDNIFDKLMDKNMRDTILDDLLKMKNDENLKEKLRETACIPTFPNDRLRKPSELVLKESKFEKLFLIEDEVFPNVNKKYFQFLYELGAKKWDFPWYMLLNRAKSIEVMQSKGMKDEAHCRSKLLLALLAEMKSVCPENEKKELINVKFLKVLQKPVGCPFQSWFGADILFGKPSCMYLKNYEDVCCSNSLLCEDQIDYKAANNLQLNRRPSADEMVAQAKVLSHLIKKKPTDIKRFRIIMEKLYEELSLTLSESKNLCDLKDLKNVDFVRTSTYDMVVPTKVFINLDHTITGYIHKLDPRILSNEKLLSLMEKIGVEKDVCLQRYIDTLRSLKHDYGENPVSDTLLKEILDLVPYFCNCENLDKSKLLLPDSRKVLQEFHLLCYKDVSWLPDLEGVIYINDNIPRPLIEKLAVKSLRCDTYEKKIMNYNGWLEFGQNERLTTRIKNILQGYSEPIDVFKEIFQNADDSGSTEIEFILDKRNHDRNGIFSNKWEPLQGPALIVINNGKFSKDDLTGIQSLGDGNKKDDPLSTGRYGVGFNSVYSITDCPVLLTQVGNIEDVMAIFDPHLKYAEGATQIHPGSMMKNARNFLETYPDVKKSFLMDLYDTSKKTLFRLPLRDEIMAKTSEISDKIVTIEKIENVLDEVRKSANYFLLFLSNIKSIYLKVIDENGTESIQLFTAKSRGVSKKDEKKFRTFLKEYTKKLGKLTSLKGIERKLKRKVCVQHYEGKKLSHVRHWDIIEQCGFSNMITVPDSVKRMIKNNELHLIPKGGIAKLSKERCCEFCEDMEPLSERKFIIEIDSGHVFCALPLNVRTGIPVLVNGNFVLDYETRRCLWSNEAESIQRSWNYAILKSCVLPCYIEYLTSLAREISGMCEEDETADNDENEDQKPNFEKQPNTDIPNEEGQTVSSLVKSKHAKQTRQIKAFYDCFPDVELAENSYWKYLTNTFYQAVYQENMELLVIHRNEEVVFCKPKDDFLEYDLDKSNSFVSYKPVDESKLLNILKSAFVNTEKLPHRVSQNFKDAECYLDTVTPPIIRKRLADMKEQILPCREDTWKIEKTIFKNTENVRILLEFCLRDLVDANIYSQDKRISLEDIPLCLSADDTLAAFSQKAPIFSTKFNNLFEKKTHLFLHQEVNLTLKHKSICNHINLSCFKDFTLHEFSNFLSECCVMLKCNSAPINFEDATGVTESWLTEVWKFVVGQANTGKRKKTFIDPIKDCSLLLSQRLRKKYLLAISRRKHVLHLEDHLEYQRKLVNVLRDFGCYEPVYHYLYRKNGNELKENIYPEDIHNLSIFGSLNSFSDIVEALVMAFQSEQTRQISASDSIEILKHLQALSGNQEGVTEDMIAKLKSMPLFENWNEKITNGNNNAVLIPRIPLNGMGKIENSCYSTFIKQSEILEELYLKLQFKKYGWNNFYLDFVLPNTKRLTDEELMVHINFIKTHALIEARHGQKLRTLMYKTIIFPSRTGERRICRELYHPNNEIFKLMQCDRDFPATEYSTQDWLPFLEKLGLITELRSEDFLRYAETLEKEEDFDKIGTVSKLLCNKLKTENEAKYCFTQKEFLEKLRKIKFILPLEINDDLEKISPSLNSTVQTICYRDSAPPKHKNLVWTTKYVLPQYAIGKGEHWRVIAEKLGIKTIGLGESLNPNSVIENIETISNIVSNLEKKTASCKEFKTEILIKAYYKVFVSFYEYLQQGILKEQNMCENQLVQMLSNVSCVLVNGGKQIEIPRKILLKDRRVLSPYLNKSDDSIGQFHDTLEKIGCFKDGSVNNYIDVLKEIKIKSKEKTLEPNELKTVKMAVKFLSESLQKNCDKINSDIYLPTVTFVKKNAVTLTKSNDCLYVDDFSMDERLQQFDNPLLMYSYTENEKHLDVSSRLMGKLPENFRPRHLSQNITEELSCDKKSIKVKSDHISNKIKNRLTDPMFKEGLTRLFLHENHKDISVNDYLNGVEVHVLPVVKTSLIFDGKTIQNSIREKTIFLQFDENILHLYFNSSEESYLTAYEKVSIALLQKFGNNLKENETIVLLPKLLSQPVESLEKLLDDHKIRRGGSTKVYRSFGEQPKPGDSIPVEHHALLRQDLSSFQLDEYIAIDNISESNFFVYGIIKKLDNNPDITKRVYGVQTTSDADVIENIPFYMIYKFERGYEDEDMQQDEEKLNAATSIVIEVAGDFAMENKHKTCDEIIENIRTIFWNLRGKLEAERKVVVRRIYMAWHPEKHPKSAKGLAIKVFQFLQFELKKLDGKYENNFESWNEEAYDHQRRYERFYKQFRASDFWRNHFRRMRRQLSEGYIPERHENNISWRFSVFFNPPPRFTSTNPQPVEARRWYLQAKYDLEAAVNQNKTKSYEWTCYIAHQAAEKAIKACLFSKDFTKNFQDIHNLKELAKGLDEDLKDLATMLENLFKSADATRYPFFWPAPSIPHNRFSEENGNEAIKLAQQILRLVRKKINL